MKFDLMSSFVKFMIVLFTAVLLFGCSGGGSGGGGNNNVTGEELDTSFLELQPPGTYTGNSTLVKKDVAYEVDESDIETFDESSGMITFSDNTTTYHAGDIILGDENTRFAKKILYVDEINGKTVVITEDAAFDEIFEEGSLSFSVTPDWSKGQVANSSLLQKPFYKYFTPSKIDTNSSSAVNVSSSGSINLDDTSLFDIFVKYEDGEYSIDWEQSSILGETLGDGEDDEDEEEDITNSISKSEFDSTGEIKATLTEGRLNVVPTITGEYDLLGELSATCQMDMLMIFDATVEVEAKGNVSFEYTRKMLPTIKVPVTIPSTPPVYLDIELDLPANFILDASIEGKATFKYHSKYSLKVVMDYSESDGFAPHEPLLDTLSEEQEAALLASGTVDAKLSLQPTVTVRIYKIIGPFITVEPYIEGILSFIYNSNKGIFDWVENEDDLYLGISGYAGLSIKLINDDDPYRTPDLFNIYRSWDLVKPGDSPDLLSWYRDADGDGYGNFVELKLGSSKPSGYVSNSQDCDDTDATIHPGATEICGDGIDQDCDGVDLPCLETWYKDADGDGYSDCTTIIATSRPNSSYYTAAELTATSGDFDDNDSTIHPGAEEICGDGIDNDCDGLVDEGCNVIVSENIDIGSYHTVGLKDDGTVVAVGRNSYGECNVESWTNIIQVAVGNFHTVGLKDDGTVVAVGPSGGDYDQGQCNVDGWTGIIQITAASNNTVGLRENGTVVAVGNNNYSQCNVESWSDIIQVAAGGFHTVGLKDDGTVVAVGTNFVGQRNVASWTGISQVAAGSYHTVGLKVDGTVVAVGDAPNVDGWTRIIQVAAGVCHTVGLKDDNTVLAVGPEFSPYGECNVESWSDIIQVAAEGYHTVGLKVDGTVVAVGQNSYGECDVESWDLLNSD